MRYELVTAADYNNLPEDNELKFLTLEEICRRKMKELLKKSGTLSSDNEIKRQYINTICTISSELKIEIYKDTNSIRKIFLNNNFDMYIRNIDDIVTRIRLRKTSDDNSYSVCLKTKTRALIEREIAKLREIISRADLPPSKQEALLRRLDELQAEIYKGRVEFGKALAVMAFIMAGTATTTGFLADAPNAIATITKLLGVDKVAEDAERERLGGPAPQRALPSPGQPPSTAAPSG